MHEHHRKVLAVFWSARTELLPNRNLLNIMAVQAKRILYIAAAIAGLLLIGALLQHSGTPESWSLDRLRPYFRNDLQERLRRSEALWQNSVEQRHEMLLQYPNPSDKSM